MKVSTLVLAGALAAFVAAPAQAQQPDFSGTWELDRGASEIPEFRGGRGGAGVAGAAVRDAAAPDAREAPAVSALRPPRSSSPSRPTCSPSNSRPRAAAVRPATAWTATRAPAAAHAAIW